MDYKEYLQSGIERALNNQHFDINGNNVLATANRTFLQEMRLEVKRFNYTILNAVDFKELRYQIIYFITLLSLPITYLPLLLLRVSYSKREARKEVMKEMVKKFPSNGV